MIRAITFGAMALLFGGCATVDLAKDDALKGAKTAITIYVDVYQPAVLTYGRLPKCPGPVLCHDVGVYAKLKVVDLATTKSIVLAQAVLEGKSEDTGAEINDALAAISAAERTITSEGVVK